MSSSSSSNTVTLEQALKRVAELEKENSKLKYRVEHLAKNLREELSAKAEKSEAGDASAGFNTRDLVLSSSNHFFGRVPLRNLMESKPPGEGFLGNSLLVGGWVNNFRHSKKVAFIDLTDGSSVHSLQVVAEPATAGWDKIESLSRGAAVMIRGVLIATPKADQPFELQATQIDILGVCDSTSYPMSKPMHSLEHLRTIAHMRPRYAPIAAVTRIRSALAYATHTFYQQQGFFYVHSPIITASDCEGAGEMFQVTTLIKTEGEHQHQRPTLPPGLTNYAQDFFEKPAYLTVSGQLNAEIFACSLSKVYTFGPTFRAEKSMTSRHLAEFWMIEPEVAFCDRDGCMDLAEHYVRHCIKYVLTTCPEDMKLLDEGSKIFQTPTPGLIESMRKLIAEPFGRCSYTEAIELLSKAVAGGRQFSAEVKWGVDLPTDMERYLAEEVFKKPVFVYNYPKDIKAFYMRLNDDGKTVAAYDLLVPGVGELVGGSQREERVDYLTKRLQELKLDVDAYWWYLDLRRFGTVPHAGFGLGFERLIMLCTGMKNIRDAIPFARFPGNADF